MAELKKKIVLKSKQAAVIDFSQMRITLSWRDNIDLDLCAFGKTVNGQPFSILSSNFAGASQGDLNQFPFMQLDGDAGVGGNAAGELEQEQMIIKDLSQVAELYICTLACDDDGNLLTDVAFNQIGATVKVESDRAGGEVVDMTFQSATQSGLAAVLCSIKKVNGANSLCNDSVTMDVASFISQIPGADILTK